MPKKAPIATQTEARLALPDAVQQGELEGLIALRDVIAETLRTCDSARDVASLSLRLKDVLARIDELQPRRRRRSPSAPTDNVADFEARRAARSA